MDKRLLGGTAIPALVLPPAPTLIVPSQPKPVFHTRAQRRQHDKDAKSKGLLPIAAVNGFLTVQAPGEPVRQLYWEHNGAHLKAGELPAGSRVIINGETGGCRPVTDNGQ